jgi:hypothetical protein
MLKKFSAPLRIPQGTWARTNLKKANAFAEHLTKVFQRHHSENEPEEEEALIRLLETPSQLEPPIDRLKDRISRTASKKSQAYDLITGKILKGLPIVGIKYLTQLFKAAMLKRHFLAQWKVAHIILNQGNSPMN